MIRLSGIIISFDTLFFTCKSIVFSNSLFTFFKTAVPIASKVVIRDGIISTWTVDAHELYLHALWISFLKSPRADSLKICKNFLTLVWITFLLWISGTFFIPLSLRIDGSTHGGSKEDTSPIKSDCDQRYFHFNVSANSVENLL